MSLGCNDAELMKRVLGRWDYERSAELLIRLFRRPAEPLPSALMWQGQIAANSGTEAGPHVGALANSLAVLASGAALASDEIKCAKDIFKNNILYPCCLRAWSCGREDSIARKRGVHGPTLCVTLELDTEKWLLLMHRQDCCSRLVALFLDKAFVLGPGADQGALRDLGSLLHPLSVACASVNSADGGDIEDQKVHIYTIMPSCSQLHS